MLSDRKPVRLSWGCWALKNLPEIACIFCLVPLLLWLPAFRELWYFGDDWDQLSEMAQVGFLCWIVRPFAENFIPLYKLLWGGAIHVFGGNYFSLIALIWFTHIFNLLLLVKLLRRCELPGTAIVCTVLTIGLPWSNIESLAWSVQWTGLLSSACYLIAWLVLLRFPEDDGRVRLWDIAVYFLSVIAAPMFHSRGVLNGLALGVALLIYRNCGTNRVKKILLGVGSATTAAGMVFIIRHMAPMHTTTGFQRAVGPAIVHALYYLSVNPIFQIFSLSAQQLGLVIVSVFGVVKLIVIVRGFLLSSRKLRPFLLAAIVLDVGYAAILGIGRHQEGLANTVSSRYQYMSLFCVAPFLGIVVQDVLQRIRRPRLRQTTYAMTLTAWALFLLWPWKQKTEWFCSWRGSDVRRAVMIEMPDKHMVACAISVRRARELAVLYNLN